MTDKKEYKCEWCGKIYTEYKHKDTCSKECSDNLKKQRIVESISHKYGTRNCKKCGTEFLVKNSNQYFCNRTVTRICEWCGKEYEVKCTGRNQYNVTCSKSCSNKLRLSKSAKTCKEKYGVAHPLQNKEIHQKTQDTCLERYGTKTPLENQEILKATEKTKIEKFGTSNTLKLPEVRKKIKETNLERYGAETPFHCDEVQELIIKNNLEKYGVKSTLQVTEIKEKAMQTNLDRYGVKNIWQKHITNYEDWLNLKQFLTEHDQEFTTMDLCRYFNVSYQNTRNKLRKEGLDCFVKDFYTLSEPEEAFSQELDKLNIEYELHNRKVIAPLEVDFYLAKYKLAIEISPTWTHQYITEEQTKQNFMDITDQDYHYNKFKLCKEQGIELITIFDWTDTDKVLSFVKSKTLATETIYARKTTTHLVKGLTKKHKDFLDRNHILGKVNNSSTTEVVEMYYNIQLVGLAVFEKKPKYTELRRLAFEGNYRIPGGASKLIKTFAREHPELKELITFSDNDLGTGHVYEKLGFKILEENKGTLIWYNDQYGKKIPNLSLIKQGTDRLLKNFPGYEYVGQGDDLPGNEEIIQWYGFVPIYDCGYTKWSLEL